MGCQALEGCGELEAATGQTSQVADRVPPVLEPMRPRSRQKRVREGSAVDGVKLDPVTSALATTVLHARSLQISICAPSVLGASCHVKVGLLPAVLELERGEIGRGGAISQAGPA